LQEPQPLAELSTDHRNIPQWFTACDHCRRGPSSRGRVLTSHGPESHMGRSPSADPLPLDRAISLGGCGLSGSGSPLHRRTVIRLTDRPQPLRASRALQRYFGALLLGSSAGFT
jgi:hypothetical protein